MSKKIEKFISKRIGRAIFNYKMIEEGDRILVGVSGGKDSLTLLYHLSKKMKSFPISFEVIAVYIKSDFCNCKEFHVEEMIREWGIDFHVVDVAILKRVKEGEKMNCYWCSNQRRIELFNFAKKMGCNKVALGHHMDDIIETYFMNICYKGETATMLPKFKYEKFNYTVIRPLALVKEKAIIRFVNEMEIPSVTCTCPYNKNSKRLEVRSAIELLAKNDKCVKDNIFKSMSNINPEYMLD